MLLKIKANFLEATISLKTMRVSAVHQAASPRPKWVGVRHRLWSVNCSKPRHELASRQAEGGSTNSCYLSADCAFICLQGATCVGSEPVLVSSLNRFPTGGAFL